MVASDCFPVIRTQTEKRFVTRPLPLAGALSWVTQKCARRRIGHLGWAPGTVGSAITETFLPWRLQFRHYTLSPTFRCGGWYWGDEQGCGDSACHPHRGASPPPPRRAHTKCGSHLEWVPFPPTSLGLLDPQSTAVAPGPLRPERGNRPCLRGPLSARSQIVPPQKLAAVCEQPGPHEEVPGHPAS